jgi:hypothetical protein
MNAIHKSAFLYPFLSSTVNLLTIFLHLLCMLTACSRELGGRNFSRTYRQFSQKCQYEFALHENTRKLVYVLGRRVPSTGVGEGAALIDCDLPQPLIQPLLWQPLQSLLAVILLLSLQSS